MIDSKCKIKSIKAREILDSRGNPTVEAEIETAAGVFFASVPSGASTGKREAKELRDGEKRYLGKGVLKAVENVNKIIAPKLIGKDATEQRKIDELMIKLDKTKNKSRLGANAILAVSMAACRTSAATKNLPLYRYIQEIYNRETRGPSSVLQTRRRVSVKLPLACFNVINGGAHAGNDLDFQEFMIAPQNKEFSKNLRIASEIYHILKQILVKKFGKSAINIGDEGGFAPPIRFPEQALDLIQQAIQKAGYKNRIKIILDVAASQFFKEGRYKTKFGIFSAQADLLCTN
jgi:enolase